MYGYNMKCKLMALICISLMSENTGHVFICLLVICKFSLEKGLFKSFADFQIGLFVLLSCNGLNCVCPPHNPERYAGILPPRTLERDLI